MEFGFTTEQQNISEVAERLVSEKIGPLVDSAPEAALPRDTVLQIFEWLQPLGYMSNRVPERLGGSGTSAVTHGVMIEALPPEIAVDVMAHEAATTRIALSANEEQCERFLPAMLEGRVIGGSATSEPGAGSDPRGVKTYARLDGDRYVVNGQKIWVSNGSVADVLMTVVTVDANGGGRTTGRLIVERSESQFESREIDVIGLRRGHLAEVFFDETVVPARNVLGEQGDFHRYLTRTWLAQRPLYGLVGAHISRKALEASVAYAKQREQFGKTIGSYQLIQEMIAEIATLADVSRLLSYRALWLLDQGGWPHKESSMAKAYGTEAAVKAASLAIEIHGGYGITREYGLEKLLRDARMLVPPDGTTQIQQLIMGRELVGTRAY